MIHAAIDHVVVTAPSLEAGAAYVRAELGVEMQPGGQHPLMGTHNLLARLDDSTYLEVIAVNPAAPPPERPRWYDLDGLDANAAPSLAAWVARVDNVRTVVEDAPVSPGQVTEAGRDTLRWLVTIPADGRVLEYGVLPMFIQWLEGSHPATRLPESGCRLEALRGLHREPGTMPALRYDPRWSIAGPPAGEAPGLVAVFQTPVGIRTLRTRPRR
jgi:hypothetical protein